ncbi:phosphatase PAP2 family protein [Rhodococcus sp. IEGM 1330]|uniref:phosphatase PAP2 family protein n=1 Tax=Rhodococcus sp. IEGM 1330 TaxID=3082225 RepID=UPI002955D640|nr:phosphatase PAP2 family protein [Rhodococcus sp. IEGM 1330]MDV8020737.1 hypothetical protein [Rhodococcus sp. IEGM 1330]
MTRVEPRKLAAALTLLILGIAVFAVSVLTAVGQTVDQQLMVSAAALSDALVVFCSEFVGFVAPISAAAGVLVVLLIMLGGNSTGVIVRVLIVALGPIATAWILKNSLDRPVLDGLAMHNSFPSGTLTCVAAVVCEIYLVTARRWRILVGFVGVLSIIGTALSVVVLKWHRPSDAIGALLLAGCYALAVSAFPMNTAATRHSALADPDNERLAHL